MLTFWILCEIYFTFNTVHVEERKYDYRVRHARCEKLSAFGKMKV